MTTAMTTHSCYDNGVLGTGNLEAEVVFVGIAPGRDEWIHSKKPFTGPSGRMLDALITYVNLPFKVWKTNLLCWWKDKPSWEEVISCAPHLLKELETIKPKVIVPLGDIPAQFFLSKLLDENKYSAIRGGGWWSDDFNCWIIPTYHPAAYLYQANPEAVDRYSVFRKASYVDIADGVRDFKKIAWYVDKPKSFSKVVYTVAGSPNQIQNYLEHAAQHVNEVVAVDIETTYEKKNRQLLAVGFTCEHGTFHIPTSLISDVDWNPLRGRAVRWCYHNGMFDSPQLRALAGIVMPIAEDTLLQSYSLDERGGNIAEESTGGDEHGVGIHGLKKLSREYQAAGFYEAKAKKRIDKLSPAEMADYNSHDVAYTYRNQRKFEVDQIADNVRDMYLNILIPAANVHAQVTAKGVRIDIHAMNLLKMEWIPKWLHVEESLQAQAKAVGWELESINIQSPKQLAHLLYDLMDAPMIGKTLRVNARTVSAYNRTKEGRTTNMYVLKAFSVGEPKGQVGEEVQRFAEDLLELRGLNRDIQTYMTGIEDDMDENDLIYPEPDLHGTRVGRLAYKKPPIMTIPKARTVGTERAKIRTIFAPRNPETHVLMEADFRQAELWCAYLQSGDKVVLADLMTGDFHAAGAEGVFNIKREQLAPIEWENYRDSYKIVVYGSFYGASAPALMGDKALQGRGSQGNYHLMETREQAQKVLDAFEARYVDLYQWRQAERARVTAEGEQQSHNGRKRRYYWVKSHSQLNQAVNFPISSLSHDHLMVGWTELGGWDWSKPAQEQHRLTSLLEQYDSQMWWEIHDSVVLEVSKKYLREVSDLIVSVMSKPRFGFDIGIPVDIKVGPDWLHLITLEKYFADPSNNIQASV